MVSEVFSFRSGGGEWKLPFTIMILIGLCATSSESRGKKVSCGSLNGASPTRNLQTEEPGGGVVGISSVGEGREYSLYFTTAVPGNNRHHE